MSNFFEGTVKYLRQQDNGLIQSVKELALIDALSFTEAEAKLIESFSANNNRELQVVALKRSNIAEVVEYGDTDQFHKVKVTYSVQEEESEKEKKVTHWMLVNADNPTTAEERTREHLREMLVPFVVESCTLTKFVEIIKHDPASGFRKTLQPLTDKGVGVTISAEGKEIWSNTQD